MKKLLLFLGLCFLILIVILAEADASGQTTAQLHPPEISTSPRMTGSASTPLDLHLLQQQIHAPYRIRDYNPLLAETKPVVSLKGDIHLIDWGFLKFTSEKIPCAPNQLHCVDQWAKPKWWLFNQWNPGFQRTTERTPITHRPVTKTTVTITRRF